MLSGEVQSKTTKRPHSAANTWGRGTKEIDSSMQSDDSTRTARPIETSYNGHLFRSRLEARWAVFLDFLEVPWEYEKEGYDLEWVGRYVPDFWLTDLGYWLEIKPAWPSETEVRKASGLCTETGRPVLVAAGDPLEVYKQRRLIAVRHDLTDSGGGLGMDVAVRPFFCSACDRFDFSLGMEGQSIVDGDWRPINYCWPHHDKNVQASVSIVVAALEARSRRFWRTD